MHKRVAIFDFDGTLGDSTAAYEEAAKELCPQFGIPLADNEYALYGGRAPSEWLKEKRIAPEVIDAFCAVYGARARQLLPKSTWVKGAREMAGVLREGNVRRAIVTTASEKSFAVLDEKLKVRELIPLVFTGDDVKPFYKPHPKGIVMALEALGADPSDSLYVGDNDVDMKAARAAGVLAVHLAGPRTNGHVRDLADHTVEDIREVLEFLRI